jgi:hypothetical protein
MRGRFLLLRRRQLGPTPSHKHSNVIGSDPLVMLPVRKLKNLRLSRVLGDAGSPTVIEWAEQSKHVRGRDCAEPESRIAARFTNCIASRAVPIRSILPAIGLRAEREPRFHESRLTRRLIWFAFAAGGGRRYDEPAAGTMRWTAHDRLANHPPSGADN